MNFSQVKPDELFSDFDMEDIPSEKDPFCNTSENSSYNESYSHILPAFFFRNKKCQKTPSKLERKNLRYFYNTTGIILAAKLFIEAAVCLVFYIIVFLCSFSLKSSSGMYYSVLSDTTVRYAFRSGALILSTFSVFFAGCRFTSLSPAGILRKCRTVRTSDIVEFFMAGLFAASVSNIIDFIHPAFTDASTYSGFVTEKSAMQIIMASLYACVVIPLTEGIIFRGFVLKNLSRASQRFGILTASLLCALSECSFRSMLPTFIMSLLLCTLTVKYNSAVPGIFIHMAVNLSSVIISVYGTLAWDSDIFITKIWTVITLVLGGIFAFISIIKHPLPSINKEQKKRSLPVLLTSVFVILLIPVYIITACAELFSFMYM